MDVELQQTVSASSSPDASRRRTSLQSIDEFFVVEPTDESKDPGVELKVIPGHPCTPEEGGEGKAEEGQPDRYVMVKLKPPEGTKRMFADICCVVDISGSMGQEATIVGASGSKESHGLSLLDVAKHGVRTIIATLTKDDRLSLVAFDHACTTIFGLTTMDEAGQALANEKLDTLKPQGGTDIWLGVQGGLEALRAGRILEDGKGRGGFAHLMLLTDGKTLYRETIMPKFYKFKEEGDFMPTTIGTYGFGYNIDSDLLCDLAREGNGGYAFIPDAGFVGTVFVNAISNMLTTAARNVLLTLKAESGAEMIEALGYLEQVKKPAAPGRLGSVRKSISSWMGARQVVKTDSSWDVNLGSLQYGQSTDVVLRMKMPEAAEMPYLSASLHYELAYDGQSVDIGPIQGALDSSAEEKDSVEAERFRCGFVAAIRKAMTEAQAKTPESLTKAQAILKELGDEVQKSPAADTERVKALLEDINGQSTEALSKGEYYWKWGVHYLPSIMFAHRMQQCNNFKDPGVQLYGGTLFEDIRDDADDKFNSLPAPKPSIQPYRGGYGGAASSAPAQPVDMAAYNDRSAGCIDGTSPVEMANGEARCLQDLVKGDRVMAIGDTVAEVLCLVRTRCVDGRAMLVELPGGVRLTPHHPILVDGAWRFPLELAAASERPCEAVYSIVLGGASAVLCGDFPCIALGHGIQEGAARHPYFSSKKAIEDVAKLPGFHQGLVELAPGCIVRDADTGLVCGLSQP